METGIRRYQPLHGNGVWSFLGGAEDRIGDDEVVDILQIVYLETS